MKKVKVKQIKLVLIILIIILLSIISFIGIFVQDSSEMKNILPEYFLSRDLKGHRRIELKVNENSQTIRYDAEGKEIEASDTQTEVARTEEKKLNGEEILTLDNYKIVKDVIQKRLEIMQVADYNIRQDLTNGTIILELPENANTDRIVGQLYMQGEFEIVDNTTKEVLMTNEDLKSVKGGYGTTQSGTTVVFINIQFNKEGTEKFKNITNTYVETVTITESTEGEEAKEETTTKEIAINIDGTTLLTTHFDEEVSNGLLQLSIGSSNSNTTQAQMQEYIQEANNMEALLDPGKMPISYQIEQNKYIFSNITFDIIKIVIAVAIVILVIGIIYAIIKYKEKGILGSISLIGYIAILLIALRYFNVEISVGGVVAILFSIIVSYVITLSILKQEQVLEVIKKYSLLCVPTLIIAIVFTFMNITMGIALFWGIILSLLYHISITNMILKD